MLISIDIMFRSFALTGAVSGLMFFFLAPATAFAEPSQDRAEKLNIEGKKLFTEGSYEEAEKRFRMANILSPDARYAFNLCLVLKTQNRIAEAKSACESALASKPSEPLEKKVRSFLDELAPPQSSVPPVKEKKANNVPANQRILAQPGRRRWGFALEYGPVLASGIETIEPLANGGYGLRASGSIFQLRLARHVRGRLWVHGVYARTTLYLDNGEVPVFGLPLSDMRIDDLGVRLSADFKPARRIELGPFVGLSAAFASLDDGTSDTDASWKLGVRTAMLLGSEKQHLFTASLRFSAYFLKDAPNSPVLGQFEDRAATATLNFGYEFRFGR